MNIYKIINYFFFLFLSTSLFSQHALLLEGEITGNNSGLGGAKIMVVRDSSLVETYMSSKKGRFDFELEYNHRYVFTFNKAGFSSKQIIVNTILPEVISTDVYQLISLNLALVEKGPYSASKENQPLGTIYFDRITKEFNYNSKYSRNPITNIEVSGVDYYLAERKKKGFPKPEEVIRKFHVSEKDIAQRKIRYFEEILQKRSRLLNLKKSDKMNKFDETDFINKIPADTSICHY